MKPFSVLCTVNPGGARMYSGGVNYAAIHIPCSHTFGICLYCDEEILPAHRSTAKANGNRR